MSRLQYTTETRIVRVMCTGRVDYTHVLKAFSEGIDGVFIVGCRLNECNYYTHGNFQALNMSFLLKKLMGHVELNPQRFRIEFMSSSDGQRFAEFVNEFVNEVREIGPLGTAEGMEEAELKSKLQALTKLIPYVKLVENEKLKVRFNRREEYEKFYSSEEFDGLFQEFIANKLPMFLNVNPDVQPETLRSGSRRED